MGNRQSVVPTIIGLIAIMVSYTSALVDLGHKKAARIVFWLGISFTITGIIIGIVQWFKNRTPKGKVKLLPSGAIVNVNLARAILQNTKDNLQVDDYDRAGCSEDEFNDCVEILAQDAYLEAKNDPCFQEDYGWLISKVTPKGKELLANLNK